MELLFAEVLRIDAKLASVSEFNSSCHLIYSKEVHSHHPNIFSLLISSASLTSMSDAGYSQVSCLPS